MLNGHKTSVRSVSYSNSGRFISSVALDGEVKLWSAANGSQVRLPINLTYVKFRRLHECNLSVYIRAMWSVIIVINQYY